MRKAAIFALLAMVPAAANAGVPAPTITITASSCGGEQRAIAVPLRPGAPAREDGSPSCAKGCHAGASRKRLPSRC